MIFTFEELYSASLIQGAVYEGGKNKSPTKDDPLSKIFRIEGCRRGIGNQGGFRKALKEREGKPVSGKVAFVVIVDSGKQEEWPNSFDEDSGIFTYYGDNRIPNNDIFKTKNLGNKFLYEIFRKSYGTPDERAEIPPIFIFKSTGNGCDKRFIGLAVPGVTGKSFEECLERRAFETDEGNFENFVAQFTVMDTSKEVINREWLKEIKLKESLISYYEPAQWTKYIINGISESPYTLGYKEVSLVEEEYINIENETVRKVKVRITQGKFRDKLIERDKSCLICGLNIKELLVASHIKPWSESNNHEKQDSDNGLLLCIGHDALFDKGYISFEDDGKILISNKINAKDYPKLNVNESIKLRVDDKNQNKYMQYHRDSIFIK
ncbi:hypothetical protein EUAN_23880 [Andreesenia angusta]|uniref:HNH nuclease domain-containing protein n=1 Tax=Andreesenia angusta TaxID=39480 RepID=A0A1S1V481_9FIRM|nr:HNH endonuclease [Andreesenia angusta]OHW61264.1 hypothetical protein EUAN_23880 [Andreesenia angusta]